MNKDEPLVQLDFEDITPTISNRINEDDLQRPLSLSSVTHNQQQTAACAFNDDKSLPVSSYDNNHSQNILIDDCNHLENVPKSPISNDCNGVMVTPNHLQHQHSLISLTSNSSGLEDIVNYCDLIGDDVQQGELSEVNLLADCSMDSRESQPLLGNNARDSHDYVYNNFPGIYYYIKLVLFFFYYITIVIHCYTFH